MRTIPKNQLNPKIKNVWRISDALGATLIYLCCVESEDFDIPDI